MTKLSLFGSGNELLGFEKELWTTGLKNIFILLAILLFQLWECGWAPPAIAQAGKPWEEYVSTSSSANAIKILFIGHSKFYINNMPKMFNYIVQQRASQPMKIYSVFGDAYGLDTHWRSGLARKAIREQGPWDYVVLFEKTGIPEGSPAIYDRNLRLFANEIATAKAKMVLVENYGDDKGYANTHKTMTYFASRFNCSLLPLGTAWNTIRTEHPDIDILQEDQHHPSTKGTFLTSCVCYGFFLRKDPTTLPPVLYRMDDNNNTTNIFENEEEAKTLQTAAKKALGSRL